MLATVEGRIGRAFMHILVVHCSVVLLADTPSIGVTRVILCTADSFLFWSYILHYGFVLHVCPWFTPVVTHVSLYSFLRSCRTLALLFY